MKKNLERREETDRACQSNRKRKNDDEHEKDKNLPSPEQRFGGTVSF
jgi:hypothetical protein